MDKTFPLLREVDERFVILNRIGIELEARRSWVFCKHIQLQKGPWRVYQMAAEYEDYKGAERLHIARALPLSIGKGDEAEAGLTALENGLMMSSDALMRIKNE